MPFRLEGLAPPSSSLVYHPLFCKNTMRMLHPSNDKADRQGSHPRTHTLLGLGPGYPCYSSLCVTLTVMQMAALKAAMGFGLASVWKWMSRPMRALRVSPIVLGFLHRIPQNQCVSYVIRWTRNMRRPAIVLDVFYSLPSYKFILSQARNHSIAICHPILFSSLVRPVWGFLPVEPCAAFIVGLQRK